MNKIAFAACALIALSACSKGEEKAEEARSVAQAESTGRVKFSSPIEFSKDPKVKQTQQEGLVDSMIKDPHIDLETIEGEAYRRGVKLTPEQIAYKKAHPVNRDAPYSANGNEAPDEGAAGNATEAAQPGGR